MCSMHWLNWQKTLFIYVYERNRWNQVWSSNKFPIFFPSKNREFATFFKITLENKKRENWNYSNRKICLYFYDRLLSNQSIINTIFILYFCNSCFLFIWTYSFVIDSKTHILQIRKECFWLLRLLYISNCINYM